MIQSNLRPIVAFVVTTLLLVMACWLLLVSPIIGWKQNVAEKHAQIQADTTRIKTSISELSFEKNAFSRDDFTPLIWTGRQLAEVTAKVQSTINEMAVSSGISMRSIAPTSRNATELSDVIGFRLEFESDLEQLTEFLKKLEYGQPSLVVTRSNIRRLTRGGPPSKLPALFLQIDVMAPFDLTNNGEQ